MQYTNGLLIKKLRENRRLTQAELAGLIHVSPKTVSKWETGRGLPDISTLPELAAALQVSVMELLSGESITNRNTCANLKKSAFYVCPVCGNIIYAIGEGAFSCHGIQLPPLEAEPGEFSVTTVEDEYLVQTEHPMSKSHYISFMAYVASDTVEIRKLYPEQDATARFKRRGHGMIFIYDTKEGLFSTKV